MHDITLVSCNYNTPEQIKTLLKSWAFHNSDVSRECLIMEHSSNEESIPFFVDNSIPYIRNKGSVHYRGVEAALHLVNTRYMLLVDSDVVFNKSIRSVIDGYVADSINLAGLVEGDRGGYYLYRRIHPWYCFIDVEFVRNHSIRFVDMNRVRGTRSEGFYQNVPVTQYEWIRKYDVGATFLEDAMKYGARVLNQNLEGDYFTHYEGMSWRNQSGNEKLIKDHQEKMKIYASEIDKYSTVEVKGFFNVR